MADTKNDSIAHLTIERALTHTQLLGRPSGHGSQTGGAGSVEGTRSGFPPIIDPVVPNTEGDRDVWTELHAETPPITVPRPDDHFSNLHSDLSYSHKPDDAHPSSLGSLLRARRPSISFDPEVRLDCGRLRALDEPGSKADQRSSAYYRSQMRPSALRKIHTQHDGSVPDIHNTSLPPSGEEIEIRRAVPASYSQNCSVGDPEEYFSGGSEIDHLTSFTSVLTQSPIIGGFRTPPDGSKEALLSPLSMSPSVHRPASLDDPNLWSAGGAMSWGNRSRSYTTDRSGSLKQAMRQSSRRSTGSSSKSPASTYLAKWSSREEPAPQPDDEGQMVGTEYVLGKQIGFGGFSTVKEAFKVENDGSAKRLAVKIVKKYVTGKNEKENDQVQAEFDHEVRIWRYLSHPHILSLDAVYETDFATFCFTKLAIGGTLFDLIRANRSGLDMKFAEVYAYQLASAIRYLHEDARVVHRDIKLENCLLDPANSEDGMETYNLVLCDFGMAEWMSTDNGSNSLDPYDSPADRPPPKNIGPSGSSTSVAGSLEYAAPELLLSSSGLVDAAIDIWAYGVVIYAIVVGSRPFQHGFTPRVQANIIKGNWERRAVLTADPKNPDRQGALELIESCLDMDPSRRWTIQDVLNCRWLQGCSNSAEETTDDSIWRL
jgi:serine/threonine protein kinase